MPIVSILIQNNSIQFEGCGAGNKWGSLGGIKDVDGDTHVTAENSVGDDTNELKFFTGKFERMVISSNGLIGIGTTNPDDVLDVVGTGRISDSLQVSDTFVSSTRHIGIAVGFF